ncbi:transporter substrate-binding domain-containing protein [Paraburkholderia sp.]|uniref:transporter substrate-binding domain-containing protein n=1 Tax=Paraburkholderia sp. TaxID=1926495 RepID=UPI003D6DD221
MIRTPKITLAYIDEPPFGWTQADGSATGADVELADTILRAIGVTTIVHRPTTFAELLPGVANGRWDINVPLFITAERATHVNFSLPVWAIGDGFLVQAGNPKQLTDYVSLARRSDARLGIITGQVQHDAAIRAGVSAEQIVLLSEQSDAIDALRSGAIDAYASTALGNRIVAERIGTDIVAAIAHDANHVECYSAPRGAFSFSQRDRTLLDAFDRQLRIYLGSADHRERMGRFGFTASEIDPVVPR